ncbi:MAG TPA: hypothetical protein VF316_14560 [Polyangiaceae bacterium]
MKSRAFLVLTAVAMGCSEGAPTVVLDDGGIPEAGDGSARSDAAKDATADAAPSDPFTETLIGADVPDKRVGMFYLVWHAPAATAMDSISSQKGTQYDLEDIIRSNGALHYSDVYEKYGVEGQAVALYWMVKPKLGYYCIYRARQGEAGAVPDCKNVTQTLTAHASELVAAGIDHIVVDATNLTDNDPGGGDLLQRRPIEVLFEEWAKLRMQGKKTPQIAVWNAIPTGAVQWQSYLALYQKPEYDGLVLRDKKTKKKVFFAVDSQDARAPAPANVAAFEGAGIEVQRMWTIAGTNAQIDRWAFMSYCQAAGKDTTSIIGAGACEQPYTPKSTVGSAVAVAPSFQTGYGSLPHGSAGKLGGTTFRRQWATAFGVMPDWVFVSGWNEFVAQPQPNPYTGDPFARSVGLERDPEGQKLFVDTFGAELGRDLEPTEEYGTSYYDLLSSCTRVFRANVAAKTSGCNDANEPCCATTNAFVNVYALRHDPSKDVLLTTSPSEKAAVITNGFREVCTRYGTPSIFCLRADEPSTPVAPFLAYSAAAAGRKPLYRCLVSPRHFYSLDAQCEGQTVEAVVAYLAQSPSGEMPRRMERCYDAGTGEHTFALGFGCPGGMVDEGTFGFVR